jgi:hypothetical protein
MGERRVPEEIKERLREKVREKVQKEKEGTDKERRSFALTEEMRRKIRERIRQRLLESRKERRGEGTGLREELRRKIRERLLRLREGEDRFSRLRRSSIGGRSPRLGFGDFDGESGLCEKRLELLRMRNARLREEIERKREILKEAYKVVKRVEELGGIQKIEEAMKIAQDTIVKAGTKLFKEAVDMLAAETGVDKAKVSELIKKVGLKEARDILKKGGKVREGAKTIVVEGVEEKKEQVPALGARIAERLSKSVAVENPKDLKELSEAVFKR